MRIVIGLLTAALAGGVWCAPAWGQARTATTRRAGPHPGQLHYAASSGNLEKARECLEAGIDVNEPNRSGMTALHLAVWNKQLAMAEFLLDRGATADIFTAIGMGEVDRVDQFLQADPKLLQARSPMKRAGVMDWAVKLGHREMVKRLLAHGATLGRPGRPRQATLLHLAVKEGDVAMVELLLGAGISAKATTRRSASALHVAIGAGHEEMVRLLVARGADPNASNQAGSTPLHESVMRKGTIGMMRILLEAGAKVGAQDTRGGSVLAAAARGGDLQRIQLLLDHGAKVATADLTGRTPLHYACYAGHVEVAKLLIAKGAPVVMGPAVADLGPTVLSAAAAGGSAELVKLLLAKGAKADSPSPRHGTPLANAARRGSVEVVEVLLEAGARVDPADPRGMSALAVAARSGHLKVVELLLAKGADPKFRDCHALSAAVSSKNRELFDLILSKVGPIDYKGDLAGRMLITTVEVGWPELAEELLAKGVPVDYVRQGDNRRALDLAIWRSNSRLVELMIRRGASLNKRDRNGRTPLEAAQHRRNPRLIELLQRHTATRPATQPAPASQPAAAG